jgi:filamentous hemagglutinin family protein
MSALLRRLINSVSVSAIVFAPIAARANPLNGQVVGGAATITGQGTSRVTVDQTTNRAIINWGSFNVAPNETTQFVQPGASSVTLNRVSGAAGASQIDGMIKANGGVYVVNPDGILFGPSARVNVGSFLGTTHDIADSDFMAGKKNFTISGNPNVSIVNQGAITAANGGFAALVAPGVRNDGIITANLGTVTLASGNAFTLDLYGDSLIKLQPGDAIAGSVRDVATGQKLKSLVQNAGKLKANGGTVVLTAVAAKKVLDSVINSKGVIEANSVGTRNGLVVFGAATTASKPTRAPTQTVKVSGRITAAGRSKGTTGGKIQITGENIRLAHAGFNASGQAGGGKILVGGDFKGGDPDAPAVTQYGQILEATAIPNATTVTVDAASVLNASALTTGNGGKIVVWSNNTTKFAGSLLAQGGTSGGNGGFAEVSGKNTVDYSGIVANLSAPAGQRGTVLFDPTVDTIDSAEATSIGATLNNGTNFNDVADVINLNGNVYKISGGDASFTLTASTQLNITDNIVIGASAGKLNVALQVGSLSNAEYLAAIQYIFSSLFNSGVSLSDIGQTIVNNNNTYAFINKYSELFSQTFKSSQAYAILDSPSPTGAISVGSNFKVYTNGGAFAASSQGSAQLLDTISASWAYNKTTGCQVLTGLPCGATAQFISQSGIVVYWLPVPTSTAITYGEALELEPLASNQINIPASASPIPGLNVKINGNAEVVPFSELVDINQHYNLGLSADQLYQFDQNNQGMFLIQRTTPGPIAGMISAGSHWLDQRPVIRYLFDAGPASFINNARVVGTVDKEGAQQFIHEITNAVDIANKLDSASNELKEQIAFAMRLQTHTLSTIGIQTLDVFLKLTAELSRKGNALKGLVQFALASNDDPSAIYNAWKSYEEYKKTYLQWDDLRAALNTCFLYSYGCNIRIK